MQKITPDSANQREVLRCGHRVRCELQQHFVAHYPKRRAVELRGGAFAPDIQLAQQGESPSIEHPGPLRCRKSTVGSSGLQSQRVFSTRRNSSSAHVSRPSRRACPSGCPARPAGARVSRRVVKHRLGEWSSRPIRTLESLVRSDIKVALE